MCALGGVPWVTRDSHLPKTILSSDPSFALAFHFPFPPAIFLTIGRHPHLNLDRGVGGGRRFHHHAAERGEGLVERGIAHHPGSHIRRRREGSRRDGPPRENLPAGPLEVCESFARLCRGRCILPKSRAREQNRTKRRKNELLHDEFPRFGR